MVWSIPLEVVKKYTCTIARVLMGARVFTSLYVFRVQNEHSIVSVQNSIFIGEVFQIEVSGGQKVNLYLARLFMGAHEEFAGVYNSN